MSHLHANCQIVIELVAIRAAALVTADCIDAGAVTAGRRVAFVLVDALIVIEVLDEALRTAAAVTTHKVLEIKVREFEYQRFRR